MLKHTCVFGLGWGDEGKGKVVDLLCPSFDFAVRFNGGANAGHTVVVGKDKSALHLLPTGALHGHMTCVIGPGVVVDPVGLARELDHLAQRDSSINDRVKISDRAHMVLPYHQIEDRLSEQNAGIDGKIGTTSRGIGPAYADKMRRTSAIRFADLNSPGDELEIRLRRLVTSRKATFTALYDDDGGLNEADVLAAVKLARSRLSPMVENTTQLLHEATEAGKSILFEGANGVLLDVDHGTYPFVTSSGTGPYAVGAGAGVYPGKLAVRLGVSKAYSTRVGSGPFVSELNDAVGDRIREQGNEYGTTTGRPRRCGWFDAVATRYSAGLCDTTDLALLHLDTLSGIDPVGICISYKHQEKLLNTLPSDAQTLDDCEPVVEFVPGWSGALGDARKFEDLPKQAQAYVRHIEELTGVPVGLIGVGPERAQVVVRDSLRRKIDLPAAVTS